ncbi:DUF6644 family protein [Neorhizobium galegae]|uniref:DUF6644 family protein n=1 Tax=Neorhizobium galegae TaxID=399 RepID=UPI000621D2BB|nr:DUF6644 family protein [Neorhizobium galegae]KAB1126697.1 DUF2214 domain-containing protein [Neorhizobium galegae]MCQ1808361.1 DUF2214 domain-containing protein [Neorhizobium galegae]CDZ61144.1 Hypothetical protein NGAL_HAMBI2566_43680 [Neorhizobium galegae bv. orientalis]CDZ65368.1 Hypothetical protein NGAL_HAMBI2605_36370 [Neorhizobium galegae bv. orientalis]
MEFLAMAAETPLARALITSSTLYLLVNAAHILGIGMLFGAILALDLRLLGFAPAIPLAVVAPYLSRLAGAGVILAILTGLCLFSVRPLEYARNPAFLAKLGFVALGLVNVAVVHFSSGWRTVLAGDAPTAALRFSAVLSIVLWISAVIAGRWIGFL